jgi:hypothetical protein
MAGSRWVSRLETMLLTGTVFQEGFIDQFFFHWPPHTILHLAQANFVLYALTKGYIHRAWNINWLLSLWFQKPTALRLLMKATGCLVYGPTVLQFFRREHHQNQPGYLQLCVPFDRGLNILAFLEEEGYQPTWPGSGTIKRKFLNQLQVRLNSQIPRSLTGEKSHRPIEDQRQNLKFLFECLCILPNGVKH